jgi:cobalamin biosynthesis protein CobD/CbiB
VRLAKRDAYVLGDGPLPTAWHIRRSLTVMAVAAAVALVVPVIATITWK